MPPWRGAIKAPSPGTAGIGCGARGGVGFYPRVLALDGDNMARKLLLAALAAVTLAGCGSMGCGGSANNNASGGACGTHITFLH